MVALKKLKTSASDRQRLVDIVRKQHAVYGDQQIERGMATVISYVRADLALLSVTVEDFYRAVIEQDRQDIKDENEQNLGNDQVIMPRPIPSINKVYRAPRQPEDIAAAKSANVRLIDHIVTMNGMSLKFMTLGELRDYAAMATAHGRFYGALYSAIVNKYANITSDAQVGGFVTDDELQALAQTYNFNLGPIMV